MIIRSTGAIRRITGRGQIRRQSGEATLVQGRMLPRPQIGLVSGAVEVYDPSNILTVAEDLADGSGVRLGLAQAGVASPTPATAVGISVPLLDVAQRRIPEIPAYLITGYVRALLREAPTGLNTPSHLWFYVGILADGTLSSATKGVVWALLNSPGGAGSGMWRVAHQVLSGGSWTEQRATWDIADPGGVHGEWGMPRTNAQTAITLGALPAKNSSGITATVNPNTQLDLLGSDPHLVFGAGWMAAPPAADSVAFRPLARLLPGVPPEDQP